MAEALEKPEWLANYCYLEFSYVRDEKQFGMIEYWQTPEEMFKNKKGDCGSWNSFQKRVLQVHGYAPEIWIAYGYDAWNEFNGHAVCAFYYQGGWNYMQSALTKSQIFRKGFSSKEEITKSIYGNRTTEIIDEEEYQKSDTRGRFVFSNFIPPYQGTKFSSGERLSLHNHLTEAGQIAIATGSRVEIFIPAYPGSEEYIKALNKEAVGCLYPIGSKSSLFFGGSISAHGFYSDNPKTHLWMYSLHLLFSSRIGITAYTGDYYQGIDVDVNPVNFQFLKYYVCFRNGIEVIDHKVKVTTFGDFLEIVAEKRDKDLTYGTLFKINKVLKIGVGEKMFSLSAGPFSLSYRYDDEEKIWSSSVSRIRF